ncbi:MAG: sugar phosphate isomerase/epimerase family protein [Thermoproteota archaeon]
MAIIKLGINNCFAVKRWPEPEVWSSIAASDLELGIVQFSYDLLDPMSREPLLYLLAHETNEACRSNGVTIDTTFTGLIGYSLNLLTHPNLGMRIESLRWYEQAVLAASKFNARGTGGHVASMSVEDFGDDGRRSYLESFLIESLQYLSSLAFREGQKFFLWEPMPLSREQPCTIAGAKELHTKANRSSKLPIKFCIDVGHQCAWNVKDKDLDPYAWLRELAPESPVIHIQQTDGKGDRHWPFTDEYNRKGIIDAKKLLDAIDSSGAKDVTLILEIIHASEEKEAKVLQDLKESAKYWRERI